MKKANLTSALLVDADLTETNMTGAILDHANAEGAIFKKAILDNVKARYAKFKQAIMDEVKANGGDFTSANLDQLEAFKAEFSKSIMSQVTAIGAKFVETTLDDVVAHGANFSESCMDKVKAERFDISGGVMDNVHAHNANFKKSIMKKVHAHNADFSRSILESVDFEGAELRRACFEEADLEKANIKAANLREAELRNAKCKDLQFDKDTILVDAHIVGAKDLDPKLIEQAIEQTKLLGATLGKSGYGKCANNKDGTNDRFKTQQLGAGVLVAALDAGCTLAGGPLAGMSVTMVSAFLTAGILEKCKDDNGYINNKLGDKLAEIGVIAQGAGLKAIEDGAYGAIAASIVTSTGLVSGGAMLGAGLIGTAGGAAIAYDGYKKDSKAEMVAGGVVAAAGVAATIAGGTAATGAITTIGYGAALGGIEGAIRGAKKVISKLSEGKRPEEIYRENNKDFSKFVDRMTPSKGKLLAGVVMAVAVAAVACLAAYLIAPAALAIAAIATVALPFAAAGFALGYIGKGFIDEKFSAKKDDFKQVEDQKSQAPKRERGNVSKDRAVEEGIATPSIDSVAQAVQEYASTKATQPQVIAKFGSAVNKEVAEQLVPYNAKPVVGANTDKLANGISAARPPIGESTEKLAGEVSNPSSRTP
jgi:uncharacterized protein YjbI with pentapeptide repeats